MTEDRRPTGGGRFVTAEDTEDVAARTRRLLEAAEARETAWRTEPTYWKRPRDRWTWDVMDSLGVLAIVPADDKDDRGAQALAELIAAAPEILTALLGAVEERTRERDEARATAEHWRHQWCDTKDIWDPLLTPPLPWEDR